MNQEESEKLKLQEEMVEGVKKSFDEKINQLLIKYPLEERQRFTAKGILAERVLNGIDSIYITKRAEFLSELYKKEITPKDYARKILNKANSWEGKYADLENQRDAEIYNIKNRF